MKNNLNEYNDNTKGVIHLLVTPLCDRNCKFCCNKQYDLNSIPFVTDSELKNCHTLCLTGGEPFLYSNPCFIAKYYKDKYPNIKNVYVYTNAAALAGRLRFTDLGLYPIDGVNVSIKNKLDKAAFERYIVNNQHIKYLSSNILYVFDKLVPSEIGNFKLIKRKWQEEFKPANDSIFRRI